MAKRKGPKTLEEKVNDVDEYFAEEIRSATPEFIKEKLFKMDEYEVQLSKAKEEDEDLKMKRDALKVANQTYSVPLKAIKLKREFALQVLKEKGKA